MRIVISIPMEKNRDSHFCKNRAALRHGAESINCYLSSQRILKIIHLCKLFSNFFFFKLEVVP